MSNELTTVITSETTAIYIALRPHHFTHPIDFLDGDKCPLAKAVRDQLKPSEFYVGWNWIKINGVKWNIISPTGYTYDHCISDTQTSETADNKDIIRVVVAVKNNIE